MSQPQRPSNILRESSKHLEAGDAEPELQPNLLTLYSMRYCPFAQRTRLVLQHKQVPHQVVNVNLVRKPDWFLAASATGKVPALRESDGWLLVESLNTCDYLEDAHPEASLYPSDPRQRARVRQTIAKMGDVVIPAYYRWLGRRGDEQKAEWESLLKGLDAMQEELGDSAFFGGCDKAQMADLMVWPWFERVPASCQLLGFQLPEGRFDRLLAWMHRMGHEGSVVETRTPEDVHMEFYKSAAEKRPKYDGYHQE